MAPEPATRLGAVITTYGPDDGFAGRFMPIAAMCRALVVVDNTPGGHKFPSLGNTFDIQQDGRNKGLGTALNQGIDRAKELGCDEVVLFDQDSTPSTALLEGLKAALARTGMERSVVGPAHVDDQSGFRSAVAAPEAVAPRLRPMTCLPTSGMLFGLEHWGTGPRFSEEMFLDLVDFDWCWRMGAHGWHFYDARDVPMLHRLGLAQRRLWGLTYHVPAPYRHYFQFRDTLRLAMRSHVPLYPCLRLLGVLPIKLLVYPLLLDRGGERLLWMLRGILDAIRGRTGAGAASKKLGVA